MNSADKVLVIGDDTRSVLSTIRSLGRKGVEVHVAPFDFNSPTLRSRYVRRTHFLPYYLDGGDAWLTAMRALLHGERFALVIPCDERSLLPLCLHREELGKLATLAIPNPASLAAFFNKKNTRALAERLQVAVAPGRLLAKDDTADSVIAATGLPVVIKQAMSYALPELYVRSSTRIVATRDALAQLLATLPDDPEGHLIETMFPGFGLGVSVLCHEGEILQAFEHHRAHEMDGSSYYRKSAALDPARLAAVAKLAGATGYTGVAMFEFKVDPASGQWILIEVNARPWGSLPLPVSIGVDFPYRWYRLLARQEVTPPIAYPLERYARNFILDLWQMRTAAHALGGDTARIVRHYLGWAAGFHRVLIGREHHDTLVLDDAGPGLREFADLFKGRTKALRGKLFGADTSAPTLRQRLLELMASQRQDIAVLFACQGNINRSCYAQLKAEALAPGGRFRFQSAGMLPRNRRPSPPGALAAARDRAIDLSAHRSRHLSPDMVAQADLIVMFDEHNLRSFSARYPALSHKTCLLAQSGADIADPEGQDSAVYRTVFDQIDSALQEMTALIEEKRRAAP